MWFDDWLTLRLDAFERVVKVEAVIPSVRDDKRALVLGDILLGLPVNDVVPALDRLGYRLQNRAGVAVSEYPGLGLSLFLDTNAQDPATSCFEYVAVLPPWEAGQAAADLGPDPWSIQVDWLERTPKPRS